MQWPSWSSPTPPSSDQESSPSTITTKFPPNSAASHTSPTPETNTITDLIPTLLLTSTLLTLAHIYRTYLRRFPSASFLPPTFFRKRSIFGTVTSVGDADNFRLFHTPGGRLAGWGWLPGRKIPKGRVLGERTIHIRLAGVDAPELAHFGRPAQPYSTAALEFLKTYIHSRRVRAYVYKRDQYDRVVATVYVRRGLLRRDVGLQMLKRGLATVYEAKSGAEFGMLEARYRRAEWWARKWGRGMWKEKGGESPREFKTRMGREEEGGRK